MFEMKKILKRLFCLAIAVVMLMSTAGAEGTSTYMAYRSNAVTISAADGLGIVSGTFVIKDLSITKILMVATMLDRCIHLKTGNLHSALGAVPLKALHHGSIQRSQDIMILL